MREFLEKEWVEGLIERDALKLAVRTLLEVGLVGYYLLPISGTSRPCFWPYRFSIMIQVLCLDVFLQLT
jgi:hypothetical protein